MSIREQLLRQNSRANCDRVRAVVIGDQSRLIELMACFFSDEVIVAQRAAMVVGDVGRHEPDLLLPWLAELVDAIENPIHQAIRRNGVRFFSELDQPIPKPLEKRLVRMCLRFVADPTEKTAPAAFAMQFVADRAGEYPSDAKKLCKALKARTLEATPGFQNRARKILKRLGDRGV